MRKSAKIWLIVAASLILMGGFIFGGVMTMLKWDFTKLSTEKYETNEYEVREEYRSISIVTDTADLVLVPSRDSASSVVCYEQKNRRHSVSVKDGTLIIEVNDTRKWYEYIGISFDSPKVTVYIPQGAYGSLTIESSTGDVDIPKDFTFESMDISESTGDVTNRASVAGIMKVSTSTGHIHVEGLSAGAMELSVSTGRVTVSDVTCEGDVSIRVSTGDTRLTNVACQSFTAAGSTGDISLTNVIAVERFSIERSTGDVKIDACDAAEICIKTDTGDVEGRLLSDKVFLVKTDTGHINVPHSITGGRCEITTDTGNICVTVEK